MKPHVTMHMMTTIDGRIVTKTWPEAIASRASEIYEDIHTQLKGDAWIVGRTTMAEFSKGEPRPARAERQYERTTWKAPAAAKGPYAIALDQGGKLHLNIDRANGDALVVVLTEAVNDDHLAELQRDGISYIFAGANSIDLDRALELLKTEFGIERLLLEGGGGINGTFLTQGLIDEISLLLLPVADGTDGPSVFDRDAAPGKALQLQKIDDLGEGLLHLRYTVA